MDIQRYNDHVALDFKDILCFGKNKEEGIQFATGFTESLPEIHFRNYYFNGYTGGLVERLRQCYKLWKWLGR